MNLSSFLYSPIGSGAAFNCIGVENKLGIKQLTKVKCPEITLPDGTKILPIGMTKAGVRFTRTVDDVKFLFIEIVVLVKMEVCTLIVLL